jgi:hypothetical protein
MDNPAQYGGRSSRSILLRGTPLLVCVALFFSTFFLSGCLFRRRPAIPWATAVQVRPLPHAQTFLADDPEFQAPVFTLDLSSLAAMMVPVRSLPPRPRVAAPPSTPATPVVGEEKPAAPTIAPQLTQQESATAQQETNESLNIAEKNLASTQGKRLNASQSDLVSKIKGFLKDAREAARAGDWARARNLAKKAQVLSEELIHSV